MEASDWIAAVSALLALGSLSVAAIANARAKAAVQLQHRIDERQREFRQVTWRGTWRDDIDVDEVVVLRLENTGLTNARSVTLIVDMQGREHLFTLGDIPAPGFADVRPSTTLFGPVAAAALSIWGHGIKYRVHWSSPLGQVDTFDGQTPTAPPRPEDLFSF